MNLLVPDISVAEKVLCSAVHAFRGPRDLRPARRPGVVSVQDLRDALLEEDGHLRVISRRPGE